MAEQSVTKDPTAIANLDVGTNYTVQNKTEFIVHFKHASSAPTNARSGFEIESKDFVTVSRSAGSEYYVWVETNNTNDLGVIEIEEAV